MKKISLLISVLLLTLCSLAQTHRHYSNQGGHYAGGHGSSHKAGHYVNARTHNHYTHHRY
jgi:hypothetical protein